MFDTKYLRDIEKIPDLSEEEEKKLFMEVKKGSQEAKNRILRSYLKMVVSIAKNMHREAPFLSLFDLISEGNIGLIKAVEKFDPEKGLKFSTYAQWWIKQAIKRNIEDTSKIVKIPGHVDEILRCFFKTLTSINDRKKAAENIGVELEFIEDVLSKCRDAISLNDTDGDKSCIEELIKDPKCETPLTLYERKELFENLIKWLDVLDKKERKVIVLRYGLGDENPMTLEEVGKILGLTRERIRQIEEKAINKLKFYLLKIKPNFL